MRKSGGLSVAAALLAATAALAHQGVKNPAVKARMHAMDTIGLHTKVLGQMAKGEIEFDAAVAREAADGIAGEAAKMPDLFEAPEDDPVSEARREIWANFDDFTMKSEAMRKAALTAAISDADDLGPALARIGAACKACHELYRE